MKYEQNHKNTIANVPKVIHAPENVINVTIIKEASPTKKCDHQPATIGNPVQKAKVQTYTQTEPQSDGAAEKRDSDDTSVEPAKQKKKLLRLSRHIKPKNTNIIYKKGIVSEVKNGVLIRNTPTDLYKKYQEDWVKFKSFIPGENSRSSVRRSVRKKMQQKDEDNAKVSFCRDVSNVHAQ